MIRILVVDDHKAVAEGTKLLLEQDGQFDVTVLTSSSEVIEIVKKEKFDIYLFDLYMPDMNGLELSEYLLNQNPNIKIVIYTGYDITLYFNLFIEMGVIGFVSKSTSRKQLINVIECAMREEVVIPLKLYKKLKRANVSSYIPQKISGEIKEITLNEREQKILVGISKGLTNREISELLFISQRSIEYSLTNIFKKLEVRSRAEAIIKANQYNLLLTEGLKI